MTKLREKLNELTTEYNSKQYIDIPQEVINIDARTNEGELIENVLLLIEDGFSNKEEIADNLLPAIEAACIICQDTYDEDFYQKLYNDRDTLLQYIDVCFNIHYNNELFKIKEAIKSLEYYLKMFELINTNKTNNIYRQGFVQLIALFDTVVFDSYRNVFSSDFFTHLGDFKDGSIKYSEMASFQDFDNFKTATINSILKKCYLKDLLIISRNKNHALFQIDGVDKYPEMREMINRRNCHIHNNGIADDAYVTGNSKNEQSFNIFDIAVGDYLSVDKLYFTEAYKMCKNFVLNFADCYNISNAAYEV